MPTILAIIVLTFLYTSLLTLVCVGLPMALVAMTQALVALVSGALEIARHDDALISHDLAVMDADAAWRAFIRDEIKSMREAHEEAEIMAWFDDANARIETRVREEKEDAVRLAARARAEQDILAAREDGFWITPCSTVESAMQAYADDPSKRGAKALYEQLLLEQSAQLTVWRTHRNGEKARVHLSELLAFSKAASRGKRGNDDKSTAIAC